MYPTKVTIRFFALIHGMLECNYLAYLYRQEDFVDFSFLLYFGFFILVKLE